MCSGWEKGVCIWHVKKFAHEVRLNSQNERDYESFSPYQSVAFIWLRMPILKTVRVTSWQTLFCTSASRQKKECGRLRISELAPGNSEKADWLARSTPPRCVLLLIMKSSTSIFVLVSSYRTWDMDDQEFGVVGLNALFIGDQTRLSTGASTARSTSPSKLLTLMTPLYLLSSELGGC